MQDVFIAGYSDKLSARPGETITFSVSSKAKSDFTATLHRSISADPNPKGPGIVEEDASRYFKPASFASRYQSFTLVHLRKVVQTYKPTLKVILS